MASMVLPLSLYFPFPLPYYLPLYVGLTAKTTGVKDVALTPLSIVFTIYKIRE